MILNSVASLRPIKRLTALFIGQLGLIAFGSLLILSFAGSAVAQSPIEISEPKVPAGTVFISQGSVDLSVKVNSAEVKKLRALTSLINDAKEVVDSTRQEFPVDPNQVVQPISVNVFKGRNIIKLMGLKENSEPIPNATISLADVTCTKKCFGPPQTGDAGGGSGGGGGSQTQSDNVTIKTDTITEGAVNTYFVVKKDSKITKLDVTVYGPDKRIIDAKSPLPLIQVGDTLVANASLKVVAGKNRIQVFDVDKQTEKANWALAEVTCTTNPPTVTCSSLPSGPKPAQVGLLHILSPEKKAEPTNVYNQKTVPVKVNLDAASPTTQLKVKVMNNDALVAQKPDTFDVPAAAGAAREKTIDLKIGKGLNKISVFDPANETAQLDYVEINCEGDACGKEAANKLSVAVSAPKQGDTYNVEDVASRESLVTVPKGDTKNIQYDVYGPSDKFFRSEKIPVPSAAADAVQVTVRLKFFKGLNTIRIYDADKRGGDNYVSVVINCTGENCATDLDLATISMDSQNRRLIVGFEQAGASSADSTTKPFLDLYFTAPFVFKRQIQAEKDRGQPKVPTLGVWSQIRLAATPEQLTNIGVLPSNLVNQLGQTPTRTSLVQSFDFLAGLEARIFTGNGSFQSLIPGVKQKTRFYIAGGGGAISPLNATKENATFFTIPTKESPQYQTFLDRYGPLPAEVKDAAGKEMQVKTTVAFVPLDRDRFLRQWYAGIRLKTFYCEDDGCTTFKNRFPGIADFMIGQSEAVTGGSLFYRVPDPNDPTKTLGEKRAFVFRIDGFYPLPFKQASFVYLYGTAIMKIGAGGVKVSTPLILQPVDRIPLLDDKEVFIPTLDKLKSHQPNRDYYKIGVGINLTDFFNRNKSQ